MIFYFTGTGNSLAAAKKLALEGEQLVNIAEARRQQNYAYEYGTEKRIGFVFPEYCSSLPDPVIDFARALQLKGSGYTFAVVTIGGKKSYAAALLRDVLAKKQITLDFADFIMMPNNCVTMMDIPSEAESKAQLAAADRSLYAVKKQLEKQEKRQTGSSLLAKAMRPMYHMFNSTKPFSAEDACTGCGLCAKNCPEQAIRLKDRKPVWVKPHCSQCVACINRCPVRAIQYGKKTKARGRYVNPTLKQG